MGLPHAPTYRALPEAFTQPFGGSDGHGRANRENVLAGPPEHLQNDRMRRQRMVAEFLIRQLRPVTCSIASSSGAMSSLTAPSALIAPSRQYRPSGVRNRFLHQRLGSLSRSITLSILSRA